MLFRSRGSKTNPKTVSGLRIKSSKKRPNTESIHYLLCFMHVRHSRKSTSLDPCGTNILPKSNPTTRSDNNINKINPQISNKFQPRGPKGTPKATHTHTIDQKSTLEQAGYHRPGTLPLKISPAATKMLPKCIDESKIFPKSSPLHPNSIRNGWKSNLTKMPIWRTA